MTQLKNTNRNRRRHEGTQRRRRRHYLRSRYPDSRRGLQARDLWLDLYRHTETTGTTENTTPA